MLGAHGPRAVFLLLQGPIAEGAECWILHPGCGPRPVVEGIVGSAPVGLTSGNNGDRSYLMSLCEGGVQYVKVTSMYKKNVLLMYTDDNPTLQYLDQVVTPPAPSYTTIKWSVRYLEKKSVVCTEASPALVHTKN